MAKKRMKAWKKHLKNRHSRPHHGPGGAFVPAGLLTGLGVGFVVNNIAAGLFIGLGAGIGLMALIQLLKKN